MDFKIFENHLDFVCHAASQTSPVVLSVARALKLHKTTSCGIGLMKLLCCSKDDFPTAP